MAYELTQQLRQKGMVRAGDTAQGQELKDGEEPPDGAEVYEVPAPFTENQSLSPLPRRYWKKLHKAEFTHWPGETGQVVDDMLKNERKSGSF